MAELPGFHYDKAKIYHKEVILKKEGKIWIEYYAVLVDKNLVFNRKDSKTGQIIPHNVTMIEISNKTFCGFDDKKKKCYRFPFWIETGKAKYQFKCETKLHRHKWLFAIRLCAGGKPPVPVPKMIPTVQRSKQQRKMSTDGNRLNRCRNHTYSHSSSHNSNVSSSSTTNTNNPASASSKTKTLAVEQKFTHKRAKSMDTFLANVTEEKDHQKLQKTSSSPSATKESLLKRSRSLNEKSHKSSDKVKTTSWKLRFTTKRSKSKPDAKDSVVENRNVKDSMSDVHASSLNNDPVLEHLNVNDKVKTIIVKPGNGKMTLNDRFMSMSCDDVLQVERTQVELLTKSINGSFIGADPQTTLKDDNNEGNIQQGTLASKWKSVDELYLDDEGRKIPYDHLLTAEGIVDLTNDNNDIPDPKKEPCENDELDYPQQQPQQRPSSNTTNTKRNIAELFKATSSRRYSSSQSISSVDSNNVHSSPLKRKSKKKTSIASLNLFSLKIERANSWASFPGRKKTVEPIQRRENSAPSLKGCRSRRQSYF